MQKMSIVFIFIINLMANRALAQAPNAVSPGGDSDWTKISAKQNGDHMLYVGSAVDATSEAAALQSAEQDALTQMIKHFFGVKLNYSVQTAESLTNISLSVNQSELSENVHIQGITRLNTKTLKINWRKYHAWVQISVPVKELKSERARLIAERRRTTGKAAEKLARKEAECSSLLRQKKEQATAELERQKRISSGQFPLLYKGMSREEFGKGYPEPDFFCRRSKSEVILYKKHWKFCSKTENECWFLFLRGKLDSWLSVKREFIK